MQELAIPVNVRPGDADQRRHQQQGAEEAQQCGIYHGSAVDKQDGFIHLSTMHQVRATAQKHFSGKTDLLLVSVAEEALGHYCVTYVTPTGQLPHDLRSQVHLVVLDTGTLNPETSSARREILHKLMDRTAPGGVHLVVPSEHALAPDAYLSHYGEWTRENLPPEKRRPARSFGLLLGKPPEVAERAAPRPASRNATG